jgi:hypothetical protein
MKATCIIIGLLLLVSCIQQKDHKTIPGKGPELSEIYSPFLQQIIDSADVTGSVLLFDPQSEQFIQTTLPGAIPVSCRHQLLKFLTQSLHLKPEWLKMTVHYSGGMARSEDCRPGSRI